MRDNFTGKPVTTASLRKSVYPSPVWQAHLSNGETFRLSFNCPGGISTEEMVARARFQAADFLKWIGGPVPSGQVQRETPYLRDLRVIRLYVEDRRRPGEPFIVANAGDMDPWQDYTKFTRPRITVKLVKAVLAEVVKLVNGAGHTPAARAALDRAEKMLAA